MKNKKGLTLIELLAVIVIMAVLAMITTPIVIGIIEESQEKANRRSVDGLVRAGTYYLSESLFDETKAEKIRNQENLIDEISYEGKEPEVGQLYVNEHSEVALAVKYGDKCYKKEYEGNIETLDYHKESCLLNINIDRPEVKFTIEGNFNELGWSKENFNIIINTVDYSTIGVKQIKWCGTSNQSCDPTTVVAGDKLVLPISQETSGSKICAISVDGFGNESETTCSEYYKLDKTAPTFEGLTDIVINQDDILDLESGIMLNDGLSGAESTFTYNPTDVDRSKAGEYVITYTGKDLAGNIGTGSRKVIVHSATPSISFTPEPNKVNSNGWSKENMYVTINAIDYSSYGIEKLVWCGTTSNTCTPTTEVNSANQSVLLQTESNNHHICAYAVDKFGQQSETACSEVYKLDKTEPTFDGLMDIVMNQNDILDLQSGILLTDTLSGVEGTFTYNPTDVDRTKAGEYTITYTGKDLAGNIGTGTRKVTIHTSAPSISFTPESNKINNNGWSKENMYITINAIDYSSYGIEKLVWCGTTGNSCEPSTEVNNISQSVLLQTESNNHHICAYAIDKFGLQGETTCSEAYKLDKTVPTFTGIEDIIINVGETPDLTNGVNVSDALSGINGTFSYSPTTIDTSKTGSYPVIYTVSDIAGNTKQITRNVVVNSNNPTIKFTATSGAINGNGWAKANFYVTVNSTDYSGHGIEKIVWCGTTGSSCTPTTQVNATSASALISTESSTNKICAYAVDKYGQTGATSCSSVYKLDKTIPTAGTLNINGTLGSNSWYTSNVTLSVNNGSDTLSGHATTTTSHTSITSNTTGTTITVTTTDKAGNMATRTYTIKVDKNAPTISAKAPSYQVKTNTSNSIINYFNYSNNGVAAISSTNCTTANTSSLPIGTHTVTCTVAKQNGLSRSATVSIEILPINSEEDGKVFVLENGNNKNIVYVGLDGALYQYTYQSYGDYESNKKILDSNVRNVYSYENSGGYSVVYVGLDGALYEYRYESYGNNETNKKVIASNVRSVYSYENSGGYSVVYVGLDGALYEYRYESYGNNETNKKVIASNVRSVYSYENSGGYSAVYVGLDGALYEYRYESYGDYESNKKIINSNVK